MKSYYIKRAILGNSHGGILVLVAIFLVVFISIAALAIDIGKITTTRNELQDVADAAALAGAGYLGSVYVGLPVSQQGTHTFNSAVINAVIQEAAENNKASNVNISIDLNNDVVVGLWEPDGVDWDPERIDPKDGRKGAITTETLTAPDAVYVKARRDNTINSPISTFFAGIFGIEQAAVTAMAVAALSGPGIIDEGELIVPIGISEKAFPNNCMDPIAFHPTTTSCAGWHNFFDPHDASSITDKLYKLILTDACEEHCPTHAPVDGEQLVNGVEWMEKNFSALKKITTPDKKLTVPTPTTGVGDEFDFIGGDAATLFNGEYLGVDYNGNTGTVYLNENPLDPVDAGAPASFVALFDYFKYRDGDDDYLDSNGKLWGRDEIWTATVPVYKDDEDVDCLTTGSNPQNDIEIVGFAEVKIYRPNPPPDKTVNVYIDCNFTVIDGRGGGGTLGNIKGTIPNLVM